MPRPKQPVKKQSQKNNLKDYLDTYPIETLRGSLLTFEDSMGWNLLKAFSNYTQRQSEVVALDLIAKQDQVQAAAYASGYAKACADLTENFVPTLHSVILGKSSVVEEPRPEE